MTLQPRGSYRDDLVGRPDMKCVHVDHRIFPDLGINKAPEKIGKEPFLQTTSAECWTAMQRGCKIGACASRAFDRLCVTLDASFGRAINSVKRGTAGH